VVKENAHTAAFVLYWNNPFGTVCSRRAERRFLSRWLSSDESTAKFSSPELQRPATTRMTAVCGVARRPRSSSNCDLCDYNTHGAPGNGDRKPMSRLARKRPAATITASRRTRALMVAPILLPKSDTPMRSRSRSENKLAGGNPRGVVGLNRRSLRLKPSTDVDCQRRGTPGRRSAVVGVRWRPPLSVAIVTHFVSRPLP